MIILDYNEKPLDFATFSKLINDTRKANKHKWYGFGGTVDGKRVLVKGYNTYLQRFTVDELHQFCPVQPSVKEFNQILFKPFSV
jgi:hypothetical protein